MTNLVEKWFDKLGDRVEAEGARVRTELAAGLTQTRNGMRVTGARYVPFPAASSLLNGGPGRLVGWSILASAAGPVRVIFHDGRDTGAEVFSVLDLVAGESDRTWFGPSGISFGEALYLEVVGTGTITGAVYLGAVD